MKMRRYVKSDEEKDMNGFLIRGAWLEELSSILSTRMNSYSLLRTIKNVTS